jgi:hypothetical protein
MERQDLIDIASDAMSDAQDMDTTMSDLAKAAVDALLPFMLNVDEHIKFAQECAILLAEHKGYARCDVSVIVNFTHMTPFAARMACPDRSRPDLWERGHTFKEAIDALMVAINDLPPRWTDEQIAATLGIAA